jgi:hypothetical protein
MYEVKAKVNGKVVEKFQAFSTEEVEIYTNTFLKVYPTCVVSVIGY